MALVDRFPRARRLAPLLLIAAAVLVYFSFIDPSVTSKHTVTFQLSGPVEQVTRIDTVWTRVDAAKNEKNDTVTGGSLFFERGKAPNEVTTIVHAPSGEFSLEVVVVRGDERTTTHQRVTLEGNSKVFVSVADGP